MPNDQLGCRDSECCVNCVSGSTEHDAPHVCRRRRKRDTKRINGAAWNSSTLRVTRPDKVAFLYMLLSETDAACRREGENNSP